MWKKLKEWKWKMENGKWKTLLKHNLGEGYGETIEEIKIKTDYNFLRSFFTATLGTLC